MKRALLVVIVILLLAPAVLATEEGGDPVFTPAGTAFRWINSLIIIGFFVWAFRKGRGAFRAKAEQISSSIERAARAKAEAAHKREEMERKMAQLGHEVEEMRQHAHKEAAAELERLRQLIREESEKIERAAVAEIEASERAARNELRAHAARLAVARAEALLQARLTPEIETRLFRGFVSDLSRGVN